jgi:hypothetical protein
MKRVLAVCLLIIALAFPAFAGHTIAGNMYCDCGTAGCVEDYPGECGFKSSVATQQGDSPSDATAEVGIVLVALMLWLRLRA